jgi:CubicO group peptidase (beta-lactamase class C family)
MRKDAFFRIASMSKPITGGGDPDPDGRGPTAADRSGVRFIPEFKDTKVAIETAPVSARRQRATGTRRGVLHDAGRARDHDPDLLTHTSGLESGTLGNRIGARMSPRNTSFTLEKYVPTLGQVPLDFQPGSRWSYSLLAGMETLGRIVEVASGMTFDQFLKQRLFDPLEMTDTTLCLPPRNWRARSRCTTAVTENSRASRRPVGCQRRRCSPAAAGCGRRRGLHALRHDAGEWRRLERQAHPQPAHGGLDGDQSRRRPVFRHRRQR